MGNAYMGNESIKKARGTRNIESSVVEHLAQGPGLNP
jgi:hypothetical protein